MGHNLNTYQDLRIKILTPSLEWKLGFANAAGGGGGSVHQNPESRCSYRIGGARAHVMMKLDHAFVERSKDKNVARMAEMQGHFNWRQI